MREKRLFISDELDAEIFELKERGQLQNDLLVELLTEAVARRKACKVHHPVTAMVIDLTDGQTHQPNGELIQ